MRNNLINCALPIKSTGLGQFHIAVKSKTSQFEEAKSIIFHSLSSPRETNYLPSHALPIIDRPWHYNIAIKTKTTQH